VTNLKEVEIEIEKEEEEPSIYKVGDHVHFKGHGDNEGYDIQARVHEVAEGKVTKVFVSSGFVLHQVSPEDKLSPSTEEAFEKECQNQ